MFEAKAKMICALVTLLLLPCTLVQGQQQAAPVTEACLGCICEAVSGCDRTLPCDGYACGVFRITLAYWDDAGQPTQGLEVTDAYSRCTSDPSCSAKTVSLYMNKYAQDCNGDGKIDCFDYAKIHIKGGYGCTRPLDYDFGIKYENKFNNCYRQVQLLVN